MSNVDIVREVTATLATRTKAQVTGWRWAEGVVVFPDIRCPYCKQGVRSPAIWKHTETTLIGQVVPQVGVVPELENPKHAHVVDAAGGICLGRAKTAYQALFGALNGSPNYKDRVAPFLDSSLMGNHHCEEMDAIDEDSYICVTCEETVNEDDVYNYNVDTYCETCFYEVAFYCYNCGDAYSIDVSNSGTDDESYCEDCWSNRFFRCSSCNTVGKQNSAYDTPDGDCCEDCYSDDYFGCETCGETTANDDRADYDEENLCQTCFDANFTKCEYCDEVYKDADGHDCPNAEDADWNEDLLNDADEIVRLALEADPDNELLKRVREHTYRRFLDAPPEEKK